MLLLNEKHFLQLKKWFALCDTDGNYFIFLWWQEKGHRVKGRKRRIKEASETSDSDDEKVTVSEKNVDPQMKTLTPITKECGVKHSDNENGLSPMQSKMRGHMECSIPVLNPVAEHGSASQHSSSDTDTDKIVLKPAKGKQLILESDSEESITKWKIINTKEFM